MIKEVRSWSKPDNIANLIGIKKVDWSIFVDGSHIPIEFHEDFAKANGNRVLEIGEKEKVNLIIEGKEFEANLVNIFRKDSNGGSLQLRYNQNHELKELLRNKFQTSFKFIKEHKEDNSKKPILTPENEAEYMEFYQTENPFIYKVILKNISVHIDYWWVNQGQTRKQEKEGGFLWAPKKSKQGIPLSHHVDLAKAKIGDVVFCYSGGEIKSLAIVREETIEAKKPNEISEHEWIEDGYLLKVEYYDVQPFISKGEIPENLRIEDDGPFDRNGNVKQGYFFKVSESLLKNLIDYFHDRFPSEVMKHIEGDITLNQSNNAIFKKLIDDIFSYISSKGFTFSLDQVTNLFLSLKTKPFVLLAGISGTGKSKLIKLFAEAVGATEDNGRFSLIPVKPDWNDGSDLLGYEAIDGTFRIGPLTKVLIDANKEENKNKPYFICLDEMNLSRVEHYFSDFLSIVESREKVDDIIKSNPILSHSSLGDISLPDNVYIVGTVNMDETTHPFSKKVLDRANTIEFNQVELDIYPDLESEGNIDPVYIDNQIFRADFLIMKDVYLDNKDLVYSIVNRLKNINAILEKNHLHVGFRVRDEITFYMVYNNLYNLMDEDKAFDYQIMQKILPRIQGSSVSIKRLLTDLFNYLANTNLNYNKDEIYLEMKDFIKQGKKYKQSLAKIAYMTERFEEDGFTSFWIA